MQNKHPASTLETIDTGIYEWLDEVLDLHTRTNQGIYKVPVIWLGTERVWQIKNDVRFVTRLESYFTNNFAT